MKLVSLVLLGVAVSYTAAQERVILEKPMVSASLKGTVVDPLGDVIPGAQIQLIQCSVTRLSEPQVLKTVRLGDDGKFSLPTHPFQRRYCLLASKDGFNSLQFVVVIGRSKEPLKVKLSIAA